MLLRQVDVLTSRKNRSIHSSVKDIYKMFTVLKELYGNGFGYLAIKFSICHTKFIISEYQ